MNTAVHLLKCAAVHWPHTVHCGEHELVVSEAAVKLVGAFFQKMNRHLNSLWAKQFLWNRTGSKQTQTHQISNYPALSALIKLAIWALPFCACRSHTALKGSPEYPTLSPERRHHLHQDLRLSAWESLRKHDSFDSTEFINSKCWYWACVMCPVQSPRSWLMIPWSQRSWFTDSSPREVTDLSTLIQCRVCAFLPPLPPVAWKLWPWPK